VKRNVDGSVISHKAHLIAGGQSPPDGADLFKLSAEPDFESDFLSRFDRKGEDRYSWVSFNGKGSRHQLFFEGWS